MDKEKNIPGGYGTITTSQHYSSKKEQSQVTNKNILIHVFDKKRTEK